MMSRRRIKPETGVVRTLRWFSLAATFLVPAALLASASASVPVSAAHRSDAIQQREMRLSRALARSTQFADIQHLTREQACEQVEPPQALATPDPLFLSGGRTKRVRVSFIIGTDGHVHSPLILESAGPRGDRRVIDTVRTWRYRPATCNGIPTETEGKIEFSVR